MSWFLPVGRQASELTMTFSELSSYPCFSTSFFYTGGINARGAEAVSRR